MVYLTLLKSCFKNHKNTFFGILILIFIIGISLGTVISLNINSKNYITNEMNRIGYGDITFWLKNVNDIGLIETELNILERVEKIGIQPLVFSSYEINGHFSDSEGQLIPYDLEQYEYKFLNDNLSDYKNVSVIQPHEIYISPSMKSTFNVELGQIIEFPISRDIPNKQFVISWCYEDPFMGISMIDMKWFLINRESYVGIVIISINSGI